MNDHTHGHKRRHARVFVLGDVVNFRSITQWKVDINPNRAQQRGCEDEQDRGRGSGKREGAEFQRTLGGTLRAIPELGSRQP